MSDLLRDIQDRVHGYWAGAPVLDDENAKHALVRVTCETAKAHGIVEAELDEWAERQQGQPTVGVVSADALVALCQRLDRPGGVVRFRARLERGRLANR